MRKRDPRRQGAPDHDMGGDATTTQMATPLSPTFK